MELKEKVEKALKNTSLSYDAIAKEIGISRFTLYRILAGAPVSRITTIAVEKWLKGLE